MQVCQPIYQIILCTEKYLLILIDLTFFFCLSKHTNGISLVREGGCTGGT